MSGPAQDRERPLDSPLVWTNPRQSTCTCGDIVAAVPANDCPPVSQPGRAGSCCLDHGVGRLVSVRWSLRSNQVRRGVASCPVACPIEWTAPDRVLTSPCLVAAVAVPTNDGANQRRVKGSAPGGGR